MTRPARDGAVDAPASSRPWRTRRPLLVAVAGVILAALAVGATVLTVRGSSDASPTALRPSDGGPAPSFRLPDLRDPAGDIALADFAGRPVVLNFWASWCGPCRREIPAFERLHQQLGDRVAVVGINHQDGRGDALALLDETGVTYPSAHDPAGEVAQAYGLYGMPTTVFISATGERLATRTGEMHADELERTVHDLLLDR